MWQEARNLYKKVFAIVWNKNTDYFFKDQFLRATLSVSNNIAEWFERETNKELKRFLYIARWSCGEVRSMVYIGQDSWYMTQGDGEELINYTKNLSAMIHSYITKVPD